VTHYLLFDEDGLVGELDFAWPDIRLGIEADGYDPHATRAAFHADRVKMNRAAAVGWTVLRATWRYATNPTAFLEKLLSFFP
jgi:very-short-patch-repair endonuclease